MESGISLPLDFGHHKFTFTNKIVSVEANDVRWGAAHAYRHNKYFIACAMLHATKLQYTSVYDLRQQNGGAG